MRYCAAAVLLGISDDEIVKVKRSVDGDSVGGEIVNVDGAFSVKGAGDVVGVGGEGEGEMFDGKIVDVKEAVTGGPIAADVPGSAQKLNILGGDIDEIVAEITGEIEIHIAERALSDVYVLSVGRAGENEIEGCEGAVQVDGGLEQTAKLIGHLPRSARVGFSARYA